MNEALNNLLTRRSCRKFDGRQVSDEQLADILKAGTYAPTAMGRQSPVIVAIQDPELIAGVEKLNAGAMGDPDMHPFYGAPTLIVVFGDTSIPFGTADANLVIGNILNAANAVGVDSCYIWRAKEAFETEEGRELMKSWNVPEGYSGMGNVILGYGLPEGRREAAQRKENYVILVGAKSDGGVKEGAGEGGDGAGDAGAPGGTERKYPGHPGMNKRDLNPRFNLVYAGPDLRKTRAKITPMGKKKDTDGENGESK